MSIDDQMGLEKLEIYLYTEERRLYGTIEKFLLEEDQGKLCVNCKCPEYNQPIEGLTIGKGLIREGKVWTEGKIMDPANGKTYNCTIELLDKNTLKVRGYLGFSIHGRNQIWKRKR